MGGMNELNDVMCFLSQGIIFSLITDLLNTWKSLMTTGGIDIVVDNNKG